MAGPVHPDRRPALVTGASSGIGAATARRLAAAGHPVAVAARRVERLEGLAKEIVDAGGEAHPVALDLADRDSIDACAAAATEALGAVEVLVSVAGDVLPTKAHDTTVDDFTRQVQVNLLGVQHLLSRVVPAMIGRRRGDVVLVSSDVVRLPRPTMSSYVASKWGLEGLARAMQLELEGTGVRCSIVRPGPTLTEMGSGFPADSLPVIMQEWAAHGLLRHGGYLDADGVAGAVLAVVGAPRGTHFTIIEVEPEAPVADDAEADAAAAEARAHLDELARASRAGRADQATDPAKDPSASAAPAQGEPT
jgi:NADP-dependent 3-hydroxy acid dehydrogenase YdfG